LRLLCAGKGDAVKAAADVPPPHDDDAKRGGGRVGEQDLGRVALGNERISINF
jgi:hypothetical protein